MRAEGNVMSTNMTSNLRRPKLHDAKDVASLPTLMAEVTAKAPLMSQVVAAFMGASIRDVKVVTDRRLVIRTRILL